MTFILILAIFGIGFFYFKSLKKLRSVQNELKKFEPMKNLQEEMMKLSAKKEELERDIEENKERLKRYEFELDIQEVGFYQPKFNFNDVLTYVEALELTREAQKELIRQKGVFVAFGHLKANKQVKDIAKLAVSAFNGEVSYVVENVNYSNFEKCKAQIVSSYEKINTLIHEAGVKISTQYMDLKIKELALVHDFKESEQKIKEEQSELKAAMREEEKARAEAEKIRENAIEEQEKYQEALEEARKELQNKSENEKAVYEKRILDLEKKYQEATAERERATSMAQITKKGHIYIISNIGSFGENIYKIGMTRRNDPKDRVKELGDASVPFEFDIHAMVYTEDAPSLENSLHRYFDGKRINKINNRKEFFNVTIDEIAQACEKLGCQVKLTRVAEAREYRETRKILEKVKVA